MRLAGKQKLGYFPLPLAEAERIRRFLKFPISGCATLDPCIGDGGAFHAIAGDPQAIRYGIELDAYRVEQAREVTHQVIHGNALDVHCPVESLSLLYLNPPYDFECGQWQNADWSRYFSSIAIAGSSPQACWCWSFLAIVSQSAGASSLYTSRKREPTGSARRKP